MPYLKYGNWYIPNCNIQFPTETEATNMYDNTIITSEDRLLYEKLHKAINKFKEQTERIKNPSAYMLTLLYNSKEQMNLDISNQVQHDMYHWKNLTEE